MSAFRFLRPLEAQSRKKIGDLSRTIGGKAAWLARVMSHDVPVPKSWVLDVKRFREIVARLPSGHDPRSLLRLRTGQDLSERAARARALIAVEVLTAELGEDLAVLWSLVEADAPWGLAVRSSATCEDDDLTSMAGLATTELGVRGARDLEAALLRVWASAFLPRALTYLAARGVRDLSMAVIFQIVVPADAAGVLFTAPPPGLTTALFGRDEMLVNVTLGLGSPVVDGAVRPDVARVERATGNVVGYEAVDKRRALVVGPAGLVAVDVDPTRAAAPAMEPTALARLAEYARRIEGETKAPLDIEFVVQADNVWIVQARPALGLGYPDGGDAETVWSRANVGEALPGAATPLTWSIARSFCERGFRKAFASLGCSVPSAAHFLANVHGRFYLNLSEFMRIAAQVPGLDPKTLIELGGGAQAELLQRQVAHISKRYARLPLTLARLVREQMRLAGEVDGYETYAARIHRNVSEIDLAILPDDALATTFRDARRLLDRCGELALSCASASLATHLGLQAMLERSAPAEAKSIARLLSSGVGDLASAEPGKALRRVAALARTDGAARHALEETSARRLEDLPDGPTRRALHEFLAAYGDRAVREAELSAPRWREDSTQVISMLRAALRTSDSSAASVEEGARIRRDRQLAALRRQMSFAQWAVLRGLVGRAHKFARLRERMRASVTRVLGTMRSIALEIDQRLLRLDPTLEPGASFFCTYEELLTALAGGRLVLGELVRTRHAEFARDKARPDPPVTFVGWPTPLVLPYASAADNVLSGLPASGGIVEGAARLLDSSGKDADQLVAGEIMVTRTADVGLSPLFLVAAGVVTELGGPLSHAALIAREYGVPAVVNVQGVMQAIKTGDRVRIDGDRGTVERLDAEKTS